MVGVHFLCLCVVWCFFVVVVVACFLWRGMWIENGVGMGIICCLMVFHQVYIKFCNISAVKIFFLKSEIKVQTICQKLLRFED